MTTGIDKKTLALRVAEYLEPSSGLFIRKSISLPNDDAHVISSILREYAEGGWRDISTAPKDGTIIWAKLRDDIYPSLRPEREDLERWNGAQVPMRHPGLADDGFDIGWSVAAPVGHGGFPDEWVAGWMPLPSPPKEPTNDQ